MLLARQIHNFRSRKLRTFTTFPMDISPPFRPDLYLCDLSRIQMAVIFHILGRHTIIHWSAIPLIIKCICSPVMWSLSIARLTLTLYKLVTLGRDECHGFVIKRQKIHYKRLTPDILRMSSESINMWGNEGVGIDISISAFRPADWMVPPDHSSDHWRLGGTYQVSTVLPHPNVHGNLSV